LDEFKRWANFVPPFHWIALLLRDPPETTRELSPHERAVVETFARVLNECHDAGPKAILNELRLALRGNRMLFDNDIEERISAQMDGLVRGFALEPHNGGSHVAVIPREARSATETSFTPTAGNHFEQTLAALIEKYGLDYPCTWIGEALPNLTDPALGSAALSTVRFLRFVRERMRKVEPGERDTETYHSGMSFVRHQAQTILSKLLELLGQNFRRPASKQLTWAVREIALMAYETDLWPSDRSKIPQYVVQRLQSLGAYGMAQLRNTLANDPERAAALFLEQLSEYRQLVRVLVVFGGLGFSSRQLVQLLRVIPKPAVERNLSYWGLPESRTVPFDAVAMDLIHSVHLLSPGLGNEQPEASVARTEFAEFCLGRIGQRKGTPKSDGLAPAETLIEPNPIWRQCYLHATCALLANPQGKGQHVAYWAMKHDPDAAVRDAAKKAYSLLRNMPATNATVSPRRPHITAIWWLLQAHLLALGEHLDTEGIHLTLAAFMRRTTERKKHPVNEPTSLPYDCILHSSPLWHRSAHWCFGLWPSAHMEPCETHLLSSLLAATSATFSSINCGPHCAALQSSGFRLAKATPGRLDSNQD
jgi:hypothetical protein